MTQANTKWANTIHSGGKGVLGPVSDTQEILRGTRASARERYYRKSTTKHVVLVVAIVLLLASAVVGLARGGTLGYVLAFGSIFGLMVVSLLLFLH